MPNTYTCYSEVAVVDKVPSPICTTLKPHSTRSNEIILSATIKEDMFYYV